MAYYRTTVRHLYGTLYPKSPENFEDKPVDTFEVEEQRKRDEAVLVGVPFVLFWFWVLIWPYGLSHASWPSWPFIALSVMGGLWWFFVACRQTPDHNEWA
jgi:hypothetical protein